MFVSGSRRALTFRWRRSGVFDQGVDVGGMCNASMYMNLRGGARGGGARNAPSLSW